MSFEKPVKLLVKSFIRYVKENELNIKKGHRIKRVTLLQHYLVHTSNLGTMIPNHVLDAFATSWWVFCLFFTSLTEFWNC